jgi:hypothetical protein
LNSDFDSAALGVAWRDAGSAVCRSFPMCRKWIGVAFSSCGKDPLGYAEVYSKLLKEFILIRLFSLEILSIRGAIFSN